MYYNKLYEVSGRSRLLLLLFLGFGSQLTAQIPDFSNAIIAVHYQEKETHVVEIPDSISISDVDPLNRSKLMPASRRCQVHEYLLPDGSTAVVQELVSQEGYYDAWMEPYPTIVYLQTEVRAYDDQGNLAYSLTLPPGSLGTPDSLDISDPDHFGYAFIPEMPSAADIQEFNNNGISILPGVNGSYSVMDGDLVAEFDPSGGKVTTTTFQNGFIIDEETEFYQNLGNHHYRPQLTQRVTYETWLNDVCARQFVTTRYMGYTREDNRSTLRSNGDTETTPLVEPHLVENPFSGQLQLRIPHVWGTASNLAVMDMNGRSVAYVRPEPENELVLLELGNLPAGLYTVVVTDLNGIQFQLKAIKQ